MGNHNHPNHQSARFAAVLGTVGLLLSLQATTAAAQDVNAVRDVERTADTLRDRIEKPPEPDVDVADTAVVLTNLGDRTHPGSRSGAGSALVPRVGHQQRRGLHRERPLLRDRPCGRLRDLLRTGHH
jgi:hypothetical protein